MCLVKRRHGIEIWRNYGMMQDNIITYLHKNNLYNFSIALVLQHGGKYMRANMVKDNNNIYLMDTLHNIPPLYRYGVGTWRNRTW